MALTLAGHSFVGNEIVVEVLDDAQEKADGSSLERVEAPVEFAFDIDLVVSWALLPSTLDHHLKGSDDLTCHHLS